MYLTVLLISCNGFFLSSIVLARRSITIGYTNMCPVTSSLDVSPFQIQFGSVVELCQVPPGIGAPFGRKLLAIKPLIPVRLYSLSMPENASHPTFLASSSLVTANLKAIAAKLIEVQSPSLSLDTFLELERLPNC